MMGNRIALGVAAALVVSAGLLLSDLPTAQIDGGVIEADAQVVRPRPIELIAATPIEDLRSAYLNFVPTSARECDGSWIKHGNGRAICYTSDPDPITGEMDIGDLPEAEKQKLLCCCRGDDPYYVQCEWRRNTDPVRTCISTRGPVLFAATESAVMDHGHVGWLNDDCCDPGYYIAVIGDWGECPACLYTCNPAGQIAANPGGCDSYCVPEE